MDLLWKFKYLFVPLNDNCCLKLAFSRYSRCWKEMKHTGKFKFIISNKILYFPATWNNNTYFKIDLRESTKYFILERAKTKEESKHFFWQFIWLTGWNLGKWKMFSKKKTPFTKWKVAFGNWKESCSNDKFPVI